MRRIFLSAGESSGDLHAAGLARALRRRDPSLELIGLGGSRMRAEGVELLATLDRLAVMGLIEVALRLPFLLRLRRRVRRRLTPDRIDLLVLVDYPEFNLSLARFAHRKGIPVLYYIAPQVWAWRSGRARRLAESTDRVCVILPFEEALLSAEGVDVRFVGHPLLDRLEDVGAGQRGAVGASSDAVASSEDSQQPPPGILGLFPGSRPQEIRRMLPIFRDAAERIVSECPGLEIWIGQAPDLPESLYVARGSLPLAPAVELIPRCLVAITKSGSITLQLALGDVPMVIGYRMHPISFAIAKRLVRVEHVGLVNLVANRSIAPELIQKEMTAANLRNAVIPYLDMDGERRRRATSDLSAVRARLGSPGCAARVADSALELLEMR